MFLLHAAALSNSLKSTISGISMKMGLFAIKRPSYLWMQFSVGVLFPSAILGSVQSDGESVLPLGREIPVNTSDQTIHAQPVLQFVETDMYKEAPEAGRVRVSARPRKRKEGAYPDEFAPPTIAFSRKTSREQNSNTRKWE